MYVYLNDRVLPKADALISVYDHGFLYGDGVYETMRSYDGVIFMLDEHLNRLYRSGSMIGLDIFARLERASFDSLKSAIYETLLANNLKDSYIRITISRGAGPIGLDPALCPLPTMVIMAEPLKQYPQSMYDNGIKVIIPSTRRNSKDAIEPRIKSLNFLNNILAKIEAIRADAYEAVMLNPQGKLSEGTISNVFFVKDGVLFTPSIECGILDGITRSVVINLAKKEGIHLREGEFTKEDIYSAEEVFLTNTTMEVMPVREIDGYQYKVGRISKSLHKAYQEEVRAYVAEEKSKGPSIWGFNE